VVDAPKKSWFSRLFSKLKCSCRSKKSTAQERLDTYMNNGDPSSNNGNLPPSV